MEKYKIVMDSSGDLFPGHPEANFCCRFAAVPLKIIVGDREFPDVPEMDVEEMFQAMKASREASSSACPSVDEFVEAFSDADFVFCVTISSNLSGCYNVAENAKKLVLETHPNKKIHVVDSRATSGTMVLIARYIDNLLRQGMLFDDIVSKVESYRDSVRILFSLSCYDNLIKAGRMSKAAGLVATALNIRAIAANTAIGQIEVLEKFRGEKKMIEKTVAKMAEYKDMEGRPVVISHCHNDEVAHQAAELIRKTYRTKDITILKTRGLTTYYSDDKSLLIGF